MADDGLILESTPTSGGKFKVTARLAGQPIHMDTIDPANANHRKQFVAAVAKKASAADAAALDAELLRLADTWNAKGEAPAAALVEMDISRIVRPEYFTTADVTGLTVPVVIDAGGKPSPRWMQYLRWSDGRRESKELSECIKLPSGSRLWIHPVPGEPTMSTKAAWSSQSRKNWLEGSTAPNPADLFKRICKRIANYLDLPPESAPGTTATMALWAMLTYGYQAWDAVPYLLVGGPMASGKSTASAILKELVFRPLTSSNMTAPALFRTLHSTGTQAAILASFSDVIGAGIVPIQGRKGRKKRVGVGVMRYNAVEFLKSLFEERPSTVRVQVIGPDDLPAEWHMAWDERAAIMEFDGGLPRERAEAEALKIILEEMARQP